MQPEPARPSELAPAFELLLRRLPRPERDERVARLVELARQGELDVRGLFVLRQSSEMQGVIACERVAGAGAVLWPPIVALPRRPDLEYVLVQHACAWLRESGARLGQCLLAPEDAPLAAPLLRCGFAQVTTLHYLRHDLRSLLPPANPVRFAAYDPAEPAVFHQTLVRTYQGTLDCPEVNGVRTVEEVIDGHLAQGAFAPDRWLLAFWREQPAGVVLVNETAPGEEWDVGYMGVVPEARGIGLGRDMLRHVLHTAQAAGVARVTLCVDARNTPARRLYHRAGFVPCEERLVYLAIWRRAS